MAEEIKIERSSKQEMYTSLLPQLWALIEPEDDLVANTANIVAALKEVFDFFWVGVYFVKNNQLKLGPFQGPVACTTIEYGKGVCGKSWESKSSIIVPDVDQFEGHIACSALTKSEIVVPVFDSNGNVFMVLDVDSKVLDDFDEVDQEYLERIMQLITNHEANK